MAAAAVGEAAPALASPHLISVQGMRGTHNARDRLGKAAAVDLGARSQSRQRHSSSPALCPSGVVRGGQRPGTLGSSAQAGGAVRAPPPACTLAAPSDVTLGYKKGGAGLSRRWRSSRLRAAEDQAATGTLGRGRLSDVLLRTPHRGRPQGDGQAGGGVAAAAAPDEAGRAVHPQGLGRPAALGRPQEAGLVQGHGEPPRPRPPRGPRARRPVTIAL